MGEINRHSYRFPALYLSSTTEDDQWLCSSAISKYLSIFDE